MKNASEIERILSRVLFEINEIKKIISLSNISRQIKHNFDLKIAEVERLVRNAKKLIEE